MFIEGSTLLYIITSLIASLMALFIAAPFHEFAHAWAAKKEGDFTAIACKRYTLGAFSHFDIFGFICFFFFGFGWAKPVPVDSRNFRRGRKSQFIVSIAGIVMNLILGTIFLFIFMVLQKYAGDFFSSSIYGYMLYIFLMSSVSYNFMFAFFNLLPIYPLDGYRIVDSFCRFDNEFLQFMRRYSTFIYIIMIVTGLYSFLYTHTMLYFERGLVKLFSWILGI